jgi:hypothetical protein
MAAILGSLVLAIVGLWIALSRGGTDMAMVGWMFLAFGLVFLAGSLYVRHRGIRAPRRWR